MKVAVVGANGRVGRALVAYLAHGYEVTPVVRQQGEKQADLVDRAVVGVEAVVNAAGVAHVEHPTPDDLGRLHAANVELPVALAASCLEAGISLVHVSSVKAADDGGDGPYALSKREGDRILVEVYGERFTQSGLRLAIVRPLALLFPPINAGKLSRLRPLRHVPEWLTPPVRVPVLASQTFLRSVDAELELASSGQSGFGTREFTDDERGTLRDVRWALQTMGS